MQEQKYWSVSEAHIQNVRTRIGNQIRIVDKKTETTSKNSKTEHENIFE